MRLLIEMQKVHSYSEYLVCNEVRHRWIQTGDSVCESRSSKIISRNSNQFIAQLYLNDKVSYRKVIDYVKSQATSTLGF